MGNMFGQPVSNSSPVKPPVKMIDQDATAAAIKRKITSLVNQSVDISNDEKGALVEEVYQSFFDEHILPRTFPVESGVYNELLNRKVPEALRPHFEKAKSANANFEKARVVSEAQNKQLDLLRAYAVKEANEAVQKIANVLNMRVSDILNEDQISAVAGSVRESMVPFVADYQRFTELERLELEGTADSFIDSALLAYTSFREGKAQASTISGSQGIEEIADVDLDSMRSAAQFGDDGAASSSAQSTSIVRHPKDAETQIRRAMDNFATFFRLKLLNFSFKKMSDSDPVVRQQYQKLYFELVIDSVTIVDGQPKMDLSGYVVRAEGKIEGWVESRRDTLPEEFVEEYDRLKGLKNPPPDKIRQKQWMKKDPKDNGVKDERAKQQDWFAKACAMLAGSRKPGYNYGVYAECMPNEAIRTRLQSIIATQTKHITVAEEDSQSDTSSNASNRSAASAASNHRGAAEERVRTPLASKGVENMAPAAPPLKPLAQTGQLNKRLSAVTPPPPPGRPVTAFSGIGMFNVLRQCSPSMEKQAEETKAANGAAEDRASPAIQSGSGRNTPI